VSLSSVTNPSAWLNPAHQNTLPAASPLGSADFIGSLLQALQSGASLPTSSAAGASSASPSATNSTTNTPGAIGAHGHHHGHHGGSAQQLLSMLQQLNGAGTTNASASTSLATSNTLALGATTVTTAAPQSRTPQSALQDLQVGSAASSGLGRLLNTIA